MPVFLSMNCFALFRALYPGKGGITRNKHKSWDFLALKFLLTHKTNLDDAFDDNLGRFLLEKAGQRPKTRKCGEKGHHSDRGKRSGGHSPKGAYVHTVHIGWMSNMIKWDVRVSPQICVRA